MFDEMALTLAFLGGLFLGVFIVSVLWFIVSLLYRNKKQRHIGPFEIYDNY